MTKKKWSTAELNELLQEQLGFLQSSAEAFDQGVKAEAKRLATTIRVLLHDTESSRSLLTHLQAKGVLFIDTAFPDPAGNRLNHSGLISTVLKTDGAEFSPHLDTAPFTTSKPFELWWKDEPVFRDGNGVVLSRRDLVLKSANQDGGAHVDKVGLSEAFAGLKDGSSVGIRRGQDGRADENIPGAESAAIRQIAHEVLKTLVPGYSKQAVKAEGDQVRVLGMSMTFSDDAPQFVKEAMQRERHRQQPPLNPYGRVGRNEPCPCGSGQKFKRCHGRPF